MDDEEEPAVTISHHSYSTMEMMSEGNSLMSPTHKNYNTNFHHHQRQQSDDTISIGSQPGVIIEHLGPNHLDSTLDATSTSNDSKTLLLKDKTSENGGLVDETKPKISSV